MLITLTQRARLRLLAVTIPFLITLLLASVAIAATPYFTFNGGGWGHGIGMSQWGARGYASAPYNWNYGAILTHYYKGTKIVTAPKAATVRVNLDKLAHARQSWQIQSGSSSALSVIQVSDSTKRITLNSTSTYWITVSGGNVRVHADSGGRPGAVLKTLTGQAYATSGGMVRIVGSSGPWSRTNLRWRGTVRFLPTTITLSDGRVVPASKAVNYVGIEYYLQGVVPEESPASWPAEALKAQAVAARSYAYQDAVSGRTLYCTTMSQVYNGVSSEQSSTNAAIAATRDPATGRGKLVWYGSETAPVKTFFSSCSGGHTASIQDVWTSSTPKTYYTGVADADQASPNYRWKLGALSTGYVTRELREKDAGGQAGLQYTQPSPAYITAIAIERATSGYVHHLTTKWSTGESHRITGDTMRSALGLKSTKFTVTRTYPTISKTTYQETDTKLALSGMWQSARNTSLSGGSTAYSRTAGSTFVATFHGTGIDWIGARSPSYGKANVYLDDKYVATVDLYSSASETRRVIYSRSNLSPDTNHTLKVKVLGSKRSASKGYFISLDAVSVHNGSLAQSSQTVTRFEQTSPSLAWLGGWHLRLGDSPSGGSDSLVYEPQAITYASFYGSEITWIGTRAQPYGSALVSIDGQAPVTVVLTNPTAVFQAPIFTKTGLTIDRMHTLSITTVSSGTVSVDAFDVKGGWIAPTALPVRAVQDSSPSLQWSGTWQTAASSYFSAGTHRTSSVKDSGIVLRFEGTSAVWRGYRGPASGKANIYVDGAYVKTVDLYYPTSRYRQAIWSTGTLANGVHTVRIKVLGAHRSASRGNQVSVDYFEVRGRGLTP